MRASSCVGGAPSSRPYRQDRCPAPLDGMHRDQGGRVRCVGRALPPRLPGTNLLLGLGHEVMLWVAAEASSHRVLAVLGTILLVGRKGRYEARLVEDLLVPYDLCRVGYYQPPGPICGSLPRA